MKNYIDTEKLIAELKRQKHMLELSIQSQGDYGQSCQIVAYDNILSLISSLQQKQDMGEVSDGYHTFNELYYYRMLYNAAFFNLLPKEWVHKSKRHNTGEECFGGGWFIVMANLPTGQISNHYELKDWDLFKVPEKEFADEWDGHTPQEAANRLYEYLQQEQPIQVNTLTWKDINNLERIINNVHYEFRNGIGEKSFGEEVLERFREERDEQEQPKVDLVANLRHHLATTPKEQLDKEWKELEHWNNVGPTVQEFLYGKQPEVDLEKEYTEFVESDPVYSKHVNGIVGRSIARHFYELGLRYE